MPQAETTEKTFKANWPDADYGAKLEETLHEAATSAELAAITLEEIVKREAGPGPTRCPTRPDPLPDLALVGQLASMQYSVAEHGRNLSYLGDRLAKLVRKIDLIRQEAQNEGE